MSNTDDLSGATTAVPVHVVLPASILALSPSAQDGIDASVEHAHRFFGCELIQEAGVLLRLPQVVMATAQSTLQRFYYRKSLRDFDTFRVAAACLFLAAKVEEQPKRMRDVLSVFYALYKRRKWHRTRPEHQLLDLDSATYSDWRDWLALVERQVLIDLGFSLYNVMEHPHKYILYYVKVVDGSDALAQRAWGYVNDSLRTDLCVRYRSEVVACAAIFLASRVLRVKLPDDPHWYALCGVDRRALYTASAAIMALYSLDKVEWLEPLTAVNPFAVDDTNEEAEVANASSASCDAPALPSVAVGAKATDATAEVACVLDATVSPVGPESNGVVASAVLKPAAEEVASSIIETQSSSADRHDRAPRDRAQDERERRSRQSPSRSRSRQRSHRSRRDRSPELRHRRHRSKSRSRSRSTDRRRDRYSSSSRSSRRRSRSTSRGRRHR